jgi:hypothetical protein
MPVDGTTSIQTVCQMPVVRGYQMECGWSCQSCFPRGFARSSGSSSARTTISRFSDFSTHAEASNENGVYPPRCVPSRYPFAHTVAS